MASVVFGNATAREPYTEEVDEQDHDALVVLAQDRGIDLSFQDAEGHPTEEKTDDRLRGELSAQIRHRSLPGRRETSISAPDSRAEAFVTITAPNGVWNAWSSGKPLWVESDDKVLEQLLAEHYGCSQGRPDDWTISYEEGE